MKQHDVIIQNPNICFGKPVIRGTRVPVYVLVAAIADGEPIEQVAKDYGVEVSDVYAAIRFALRQVVELVEALWDLPLPAVAERFGDEKVKIILRFLLRRKGDFRNHLKWMINDAQKLEQQCENQANHKHLLLLAARLAEVSPIPPNNTESDRNNHTEVNNNAVR